MINAGDDYEKITIYRISDHRSFKRSRCGKEGEEVCRQHGISSATYYNWKSKYGGMQASDLKRMKEMERDLGQYKRMYAELAHERTLP